MTDLLTDYLWKENLLGFIVAFYGEPLSQGFFTGFVFYIVISVVYLRYQSLGATLAILVLLSGGIYALIPVSAWHIVGLFMALTLGGMLTYFFTRR